jgi:hypothetical protein
VVDQLDLGACCVWKTSLAACTRRPIALASTPLSVFGMEPDIGSRRVDFGSAAKRAPDSPNIPRDHLKMVSRSQSGRREAGSPASRRVGPGSCAVIAESTQFRLGSARLLVHTGQYPRRDLHMPMNHKQSME